MGHEVTLTASDGGHFAAYLAVPARTPAPGLVVLPEVFNTNPHIRAVADGTPRKGSSPWHPTSSGGRSRAATSPIPMKAVPRPSRCARGSTPTSSPATWATSSRRCARDRTAPAGSA